MYVCNHGVYARVKILFHKRTWIQASTILEFKTVTKKGFLNVDVDGTIRLV